MRTLPKGYPTLLCGELARVDAMVFTGIFSVLIVGLAAGVGSVLAARRWRD